MGIGSHIGVEAAKEMRQGIGDASSDLVFGMEKVAKSGERISKNMLAGWRKNLKTLQHISKDFNSTIHTTVTKTLLSVEKAIELGNKVTDSMLLGWMASLKEVNHLVKTLPYVGQHTGEFFALKAVEVISRGVHVLLKHPLGIFIIIMLALLLALVNFRIFVVLIRDPIFQALSFTTILVSAAYFWNKQNKLTEQQSDSSKNDDYKLQEPPPHPDYLTACRYGSDCRNIGDAKHREKYSHPSPPRVDKHAPCRYGSDCRNIGDAKHREKYSHPSPPRVDKHAPCRYGSDCHDIEDANHREKYSHPSPSRDAKLVPCRYGSDCHNIGDANHSKKYSHPSACRYGSDCRNIGDAKHRETYSHH
ncbi:unnamed protein product [Rotaria magnacalcarata]|uniref:Uncharacterized protein n=2 Tax=Rotaria magnacalcarata TaxID=392030 RepID=A0A814U353_9BILA|nr:unnamed protein product [Rotaria magnacalcarata]CAF1672569.1 unnamed protein product [Rotaria magnacalcarata]